MAISCNDDAFLEARLTAVETRITELWSAAADVNSGQTYRLDTGQTSVSVTRSNITELYKRIDQLMNERTMLRQQLGCTGNVVLTPGF